MKRLATVGAALAAALAVTPAHAGTSYDLDAKDYCYVGSIPQATLHCKLANEGGAYFNVNDIPLPTHTVQFAPLANLDEEAEFAAPFDSILLRVGNNTFSTLIFSTGDDAGDYIDTTIDLVSPTSRLTLWTQKLRGGPWVGTRTVNLTLAQIDPALSMSLQKLQSAIDAAFDALIRDAATIQNLDLRLDELQNLQDDLDALVDAGIENITEDALDGLLAKYGALEPSLLDPLRDVVKTLQMDVASLTAEVQRIEGEFQQQLSDLDQQLGVQSPPGVDLHAPGTYTPGVGGSTVPPIDIPPLTGPDDWEPSHDPFAAVADDTIARLQATLSGGKVADRAGFYDAYTDWTDNQKALSQWIVTRAPYQRKEYAAYIAAQQRVETFVRPFVDAQGWLVDAPIPQDIKNLIDVLKRLKMEMQARNAKRALNQWDPAQPNPQRDLVLETMRGAVGGFISLEDADIDPNEFPDAFKMFTQMMDDVVVAIKDAVFTVLSFTEAGPYIFFCEAVTGYRNCLGGGDPNMSQREQMWSGVAWVGGSELFWKYAGKVLKPAGQKVAAVVEKLLAKLADRIRLKALLTLLEKDGGKLADLLQLFKPDELEQVAKGIGEKEFTVIMRDLEAAELRKYVDLVGQQRLAELAAKFDGSVLKYYTAEFWAAFKGLTADTEHHLIVGDGVVSGSIKGLHDKAAFLDYVVTQGEGVLVSTTVNPANASIVRYEYKLYKTVQPPTFYAINRKTVIDGLANDYAVWEKRAQEAMNVAMRKKSFPLTDQGNTLWSGVSSDGTKIESYFRQKQIPTFYVVF